jgi:hypothetical protein
LAEDRRFLAEDHRFCALTNATSVTEESDGSPSNDTDKDDDDGELCRKIGDGVNQAADLISATASIPSLNFIPLTTFGNWF